MKLQDQENQPIFCSFNLHVCTANDQFLHNIRHFSPFKMKRHNVFVYGNNCLLKLYFDFLQLWQIQHRRIFMTMYMKYYVCLKSLRWINAVPATEHTVMSAVTVEFLSRLIIIRPGRSYVSLSERMKEKLLLITSYPRFFPAKQIKEQESDFTC